MEAFGARRFDAWLARRQALSAPVLLGVRNAFRNRGRLLLTLGLLASGGAMFMAARNTGAAWSVRLDEVSSGRQYDVSIRFKNPQPIDKAVAIARGVPGVSGAEAWGFASASWEKETGVQVVHTYPDKGHGSFQVLGVPAATKLLDFPVVAPLAAARRW